MSFSSHGSKKLKKYLDHDREKYLDHDSEKYSDLYNFLRDVKHESTHLTSASHVDVLKDNDPTQGCTNI